MSSGQSTSAEELKNVDKEGIVDTYTSITVQQIQCKICCKNFTKGRAFELHMLIHTKKKPFACTECDRGYCKQGALERHVRLIHGQKWVYYKTQKGEFPCEKCHISFVLESDLTAHILTHTNNKKPFECTICSYKSGSISALKTHLIVHTDEKLSFCLHCGKKYHCKSFLLIHLMTHTNVKLFSCSECGQKFRQRSLRNKHLLKHQQNDNGILQKENVSTKPSQNEKEIKLLDQDVLDIKDSQENTKFVLASKLPRKGTKKLFSCSICNYTYTNISVLRQHLLVHADENFKICTHCDKEFQFKSFLLKHLLVHTNVKSYNQLEKGNDNHDIQINTQRKYLYACSECDYKSTKNGLLEKHLLKHQKSSIECTLCDYKTTNKLDLDIHFSSHTGEMPVYCSTCGYKAAFQRNLDQHYKMTHKDEPTNISIPMTDLKIFSSV